MSQLANLGKYHILERLAADEVSEIYKVKTLGIAGFEKVQVLKRILPRYSRNPKFLRAFIDEAKIAFSLNHRNIVQVFEFGKIDGDLFLAMEYIPGVNLQKVVLRMEHERRPLPVGLTCYLMGEVAAGLEYAHRKADHFGQELGIVHCAVAPRNIACSFEGSVKILDFGISRAVWTVLRKDLLLRADPRYVSPEQVRGESLDSASDLFSFGVILWELLTGRALFDGSTPETTLSSVLESGITPPHSINPEVPPHLDDLTMRCLAQDRRGRIASASDLQLELHRIQRMLGAVIGSRALSTFLEELFPDHGDARDVRQELSAELLTGGGRAASVQPTDSLVNAAAELAEPPNPPAQPVLDWSSEPEAVRSEPPQSDSAVPMARSGVLRIGRQVDDEVTVGPRRTRRPSGHLPAIFPSSSQEVTAGPILHEEKKQADAREQALPPIPSEPSITVEREPSAEELSYSDLVALDEEDTLGGEEAAESSSSAQAAGEPALRPEGDDLTASPMVVEDDEPTVGPELLPDDEDWSEPTAGPILAESPATAEPPVDAAGIAGIAAESVGVASKSDLDAAAAAALSEKKRFVGVAVLLSGPPSLQEEAIALIADIAFKLDGIVHESESGRLVAAFGLPAADEHDIVSAARFALDAREAVAHLGPAAAPRPESDWVRVGIRAGTARLGERGKAGPTYQVLGNAVEEIVALARHAPPGQILLAGGAAQLASAHYVLREETGVNRRGKLVRCQRLLGPRLRPQHRKPAPGSAFVGREVELRAMRSLWREVLLRGAQRSMVIAGEPGIGKTRLLDEFLSNHASDARAIAVTVTPHRRGTPNAVLIDLLRAVSGSWSAAGERSRTRLLAGLEQVLGQEEHQTLEVLRTLLSPGMEPEPEVGEGFSRRRVQLAMRSLANRLAATRPTVIAIDDLHWADSASKECLSFLIEHPEEATGPLFFVLTQRLEDGTAPQSPSSDTGSFVQLDELDDRDRQRMIIEELGERATPPVINEVVRRAGGNPFYISELTRALRELTTKGPSEIPPTVQGVVAGRLDRLPASVKLVLQHAAVIGPTFREGVLAKLVGRNPARPLALLRNAGLIVPGLRTAAPTASTSGLSEQFEREWAFRHLLIQELVYEAISSPARRNLHRLVADIMLKRINRGSSDSPAELARHLEASAQTRLAADYYLRAANDAAAAFASREALELYDSALRLGEGDPLHDYHVYAGRERVLDQLGLHQRQDDDLESLRRLCGDEPARLADLRNREAHRLLRLGEFYRALAAAEQAEAAATKAGDELSRGEALRLRGEAYERLNDHPRALDAVTKALRIFEEQQARPSQVRARIGLGRIYLVQAKYDEAFAHYTPALELIKQTGDQWQERVLRNSLAVVHYCRGDFAKALDEALYSLRLCEQFGDRAREGDNASVVGIVYLELGLYDFARRYLEDALAIHRETGSRWSEADTLVYLGLLEASSRRFHGAIRFLEEAKEIAERIGAKYIAINARNALAWSLCERNAPNDAARAISEATEAAEAARAGRLIVGEIPGLSRSARATALTGNLEAARALSRRAVELLGEQRIIESSEEEIYYTHFRILIAMHDAAGLDHLGHAQSGLESKLARLDKQEWREAFQKVPLHAAITRDHLRLQTTP